MNLRHIWMINYFKFISLITAIFIFFGINGASAEKLHIAVASNFAMPMKTITERFMQQTGITVTTSHASTGTLYAQITHGAPFDILLAADLARPEKLIQQNLADASSLHTYAKGKLVLWSQMKTGDCLEIFKTTPSGRIALANPEIAPYGAAARQVLEKLGLWEIRSSSMIMGNNIAQTFQFVETGNAPFGFVAKSLFISKADPEKGCTWDIPLDYYNPIAQGSVILKRTKNHDAAQQFVAFLMSDETQNYLKTTGY